MRSQPSVKKENPKTTKQSMKQKHQTYQTALAAVALLAATTMAHAYDAPAGGWGYIYDGSGGAAGRSACRSLFGLLLMLWLAANVGRR